MAQAWSSAQGIPLDQVGSSHHVLQAQAHGIVAELHPELKCCRLCSIFGVVLGGINQSEGISCGWPFPVEEEEHMLRVPNLAPGATYDSPVRCRATPINKCQPCEQFLQSIRRKSQFSKLAIRLQSAQRDLVKLPSCKPGERRNDESLWSSCRHSIRTSRNLCDLQSAWANAFPLVVLLTTQRSGT